MASVAATLTGDGNRAGMLMLFFFFLHPVHLRNVFQAEAV